MPYTLGTMTDLQSLQDRVVQLLKEKASTLSQQYEDNRGSKKGNPYRYCKGCELHAPQISISGHRTGCHVAELRKELSDTLLELWKLEHNGDASDFYDDKDSL